jgi:hypothetical protein
VRREVTQKAQKLRKKREKRKEKNAIVDWFGGVFNSIFGFFSVFLRNFCAFRVTSRHG